MSELVFFCLLGGLGIIVILFPTRGVIMTEIDFEGLVARVAARLCVHEDVRACDHHKNIVRSVLIHLRPAELRQLEHLHDDER